MCKFEYLVIVYSIPHLQQEKVYLKVPSLSPPATASWPQKSMFCTCWQISVWDRQEKIVVCDSQRRPLPIEPPRILIGLLASTRIKRGIAWVLSSVNLTSYTRRWNQQEYWSEHWLPSWPDHWDQKGYYMSITYRGRNTGVVIPSMMEPAQILIRLLASFLTTRIKKVHYKRITGVLH